jgi:hypothetical protein
MAGVAGVTALAEPAMPTASSAADNRVKRDCLAIVILLDTSLSISYGGFSPLMARIYV